MMQKKFSPLSFFLARTHIHTHTYTRKMAERAVAVVLEFSSGHPQLAFLSNFYAQDVRIADDQFPDDVVYHSAEAYFQAAKYAGRVDARDIKQRNFAGPQVTPMQAKRRGGKRGIGMTAEELRDWEGDGDAHARRVRVMRAALAKKFALPQLRAQLLQTGDAVLVERLPRFPDAFWGKKKSGEGKNMLGKLLMELRAALASRREREESGERAPSE